jgi:hypothetical protein
MKADYQKGLPTFQQEAVVTTPQTLYCHHTVRNTTDCTNLCEDVRIRREEGGVILENGAVYFGGKTFNRKLLKLFII